MDRSALAKIETGQRRTGAAELANIARRLGYRIDWFLDEDPDPIVSHRNLQDPGAPSPAIDDVAERIVTDVEFVTDHSPSLFPVCPEPQEVPASNDAAEALAAWARELLEVAPEDPFVDLVRAVSSQGLLPFSLALGDESADAATVLLRRGGVCLVNGTLKVGRRRLALAHELGHYLVADDFTVDFRVAQSEGVDAKEARLDRFARSLLLPSEGVSEFWGRTWEDSRADLRRTALLTASCYRVDMSTLARRLLELQLVNNADAHSVRGVRTKKHDIVELDLYVPGDLEPPCLPVAYEQAVLALFRGEVITPERALDLLLQTYEPEDLPDLPMVSEGEIWQFTS
jgi:Zn-dependent peptidase ImmA (M78 family)